MGWHQIIFSIQAYGRFKGNRKVNIDGLVDKTCQITFAYTSTHYNEDAYDFIEDDSDPKCLVKLLWCMAHMFLKEQEHLICREAASVKHRPKSFAAKMVEAGAPYIKILPNNHYGKNYMDKLVKQLCDRTGVPPPLKGKIGNRGARGHGIEMLDKAKVLLVEITMDASHEGLGVHESYMQGCQDTRDQKHEAQMLDPSCVVKYVAPRTSANPKALLGVTDEIVPRKGTMLE
jgi:hypothetical protein